MLKTRFTELVGCTVPIQQAGLGGFATPRLAAAVAEAGALGMVSVGGLEPDTIARALHMAREQTSGVIGANFLVPFFDPEDARERVAAAASKARVVDFFYGEPDASLIDAVHVEGALACWQIGSLDEAVAAERAGCDFIIAQGIEAGGHVRSRIGLLALLGEVLETVNVPVLAAGGIGTGRAMAAALATGAEGVRVGTRFAASEEAEAHPDYLKALISARAGDTVYTEAFSVGWPDAPHRVLRSCLEAAEALQDDVIGERYIPLLDTVIQWHRYQIGAITRHTTGYIEAMPHWAGESVGGVKSIQSAQAVVSELVEEAERYLRRWCGT